MRCQLPVFANSRKTSSLAANKNPARIHEPGFDFVTVETA
jgi:hypothetical protein